jgi:lipid-A-disaccharide synthase
LGPLDAGQAVVVANGTVVAIEGAEGTDAMLERVARLRRNGAGMRGVLAKGPKPGQELRVDMPAIGPRTVERAAGAGLAGIAVEAGALLVLGPEEAVRDADAAGIALEGLPRSVASAVTPASAPPLTSRRGRLMSRRCPSRRDRRDVDLGLAVVDRLTPFRTGAAVVVSRAYILAVAAQESPAAMLERVGALRQWGARGKRRVGVLVCRADEPADAAQVREVCAQATRQGLAGIAVTGAPYVMDACEDVWRGAGAGDLFLALFRHSEEK